MTNLWQEVKNLLDETTGLSFTPLNATVPLPCGSYTLQTVQTGAINQGLLSLRIYADTFEEVLAYESQLKNVLDLADVDKGIETDSYFLRSRLSTSLSYEMEQGIYDLAISFILKWKEK